MKDPIQDTYARFANMTWDPWETCTLLEQHMDSREISNCFKDLCLAKCIKLSVGLLLFSLKIHYVQHRTEAFLFFAQDKESLK